MSNFNFAKFVTLKLNLDKPIQHFPSYGGIHQFERLLDVVLTDRDPYERGPAGELQDVVLGQGVHLNDCQGSPS